MRERERERGGGGGGEGGWEGGKESPHPHTHSHAHILTQHNVEQFIDELSSELDANWAQVHVHSNGTQDLRLLGLAHCQAGHGWA